MLRVGAALACALLATANEAVVPRELQGRNRDRTPPATRPAPQRAGRCSSAPTRPVLEWCGREDILNTELADSAFPIAHGAAMQQNAVFLPAIQTSLNNMPVRSDMAVVSSGTNDGVALKQMSAVVASEATVAAGNSVGVNTSEIVASANNALGLSPSLADFVIKRNMAPITCIYEETNQVCWSNTFSNVVKIDRSRPDCIQVVDSVVRENWDVDLSKGDLFHGAYSLMTSEGLFVVPTTSVMLSYRNAVAGDPFSRIALGPRFDLQNIPGVDLNDGFRGAGLLYDGCIAVATRLGSVVVLRPNFQFAARILLDQPTEVANSIAIDEQGGIYVVTPSFLHKVIWDGTELRRGWSSPYDMEQTFVQGKLGKGSGTTPAIFMHNAALGCGVANNCFVTIADNSVIMKAVVYDAWTGANVGEIPLTFGLTNPVSTSTENSFTVLDDGIFVINNVFRDYPPPNNWANYAVAKGDPSYGVQKVIFGRDGVLRLGWSRPDVSMPSAIPIVSKCTRIVYGIGRRPVTYAEVLAQCNQNTQCAGRLWADIRQRNGNSDALLRQFSPQIGAVLAPADLASVNGTRRELRNRAAEQFDEHERMLQRGRTPQQTQLAWTLEGLDWDTGATRVSMVLGGGMAFNPFYSQVTIGPDREIIYGGLFGWNRIRPRA
jgi:hypothetical protein